jgi:hypothetical protein
MAVPFKLLIVEIQILRLFSYLSTYWKPWDWSIFLPARKFDPVLKISSLALIFGYGFSSIRFVSSNRAAHRSCLLLRQLHVLRSKTVSSCLYEVLFKKLECRQLGLAHPKTVILSIGSNKKNLIGLIKVFGNSCQEILCLLLYRILPSNVVDWHTLLDIRLWYLQIQHIIYPSKSWFETHFCWCHSTKIMPSE